MSYTVLARKYRPQDFQAIIGQEHITTTLKNALTHNQIAHAYLFAGPRGTGKTSTARILAKAINCEKGPTFHPCGKCRSCVEISEGKFLDCIEIDGASNRLIDDIRDLREKVKFAPISGKYKVYIIDEVHQITTDAFNALLKTLEEPPSFVKFIFATTAPEKVPITILSRCQRFDFKLLPAKKIAEKLTSIAHDEKITIDEESVLAIAAMAEGSMRDAETILDQARAFSNNNIRYASLIESMGLIENASIIAIFDCVEKAKAQEALVIVNDILARGRDILQLINALIAHARNLLVAKYEESRESLMPYSRETIEAITAQSQRFNLDQLLYIFAVLQQAYETTRRFADSKYPLEMALVKLAMHGEKFDVKELIASIKDLQSKTAHTPHHTAHTPSHVHRSPHASTPPGEDMPRGRGAAQARQEQKEAATHGMSQSSSGTDTMTAPLSASRDVREEFSPGVSKENDAHVGTLDEVNVHATEHRGKNVYDEDVIISESVKNNWEEILKNIQSRRMSLATLLVQATIMGVNDKTLTIAFSKKANFSKEIIEHASSKKIVEEELSKFLERTVRLNIVLFPEREEDALIASSGDAASGSGQDSSRDIEPIIKNALDIFNGRLT
jgi:DNA polymerase-3 subunit gamma/tau